jgi:hypothetical protein
VNLVLEQTVANSQSSVPSYVFLDSWCLSRYTKGEFANRLSSFIRSLDLTIVLDQTSFYEIYNPDWRNAPSVGRDRVVCQFLSDHSCVIVDAQDVIFSEIRAYPNRLPQLPIIFDLNDIDWCDRFDSLLMFLRSDPLFVEAGKDITKGVLTYDVAKTGWLENADAIINYATAAGILLKMPDGRIDTTASNKEGFLQYLDRRYLAFRHHASVPAVEQQKLEHHLTELMNGTTAKLPGLRLSSLCFWYAYVDIDKSNTPKRQRSDIGDLYRMALVPYCSYFTADKTMARLIQRIVAEMPQDCEVLDEGLLLEKLANSSRGAGFIPRY